MPVYAYTALSADGARAQGTVAADSPADARRQLRLRGLRLTRFSPVREKKRYRPSFFISRARRSLQVNELARQLAILLRTGVPLAQALDVLIAQSSGKFQPVLRDIREQIASGLSLADALCRHPSWFEEAVISAVRVGQISGSLHYALSELADYLGERQSLRTKLTGALMYPLVLLVLGLAVVLFLMTFVMPQLLAVLTASGRPLPTSTMALKWVSDLLIAHAGLICVGLSLALFGTLAMSRTGWGQRAWHRLQLRIPMAGPLIAKATIVQFAQMAVLLLRAGVPFLEVLIVVQRSVRNRVLQDELSGVRAAVEAGSDIAPTLAGSRIFPPLVAHLVAVGQETGELTDMLQQVKAGYQIEVHLAIGRFTAALEPLLIVLLAGVIGFVIFATMMPILEATRVMG